jgi:hypothetical protein
MSYHIFDALPRPSLGQDGSFEKPSKDFADIDRRIVGVSTLELQQAIIDGDLAALRSLFKSTGNDISEVYYLLPEETDNAIRLQLIFESAISGHDRPVDLLTKAANSGQAWAFYGLERLADMGLQRAQIAFERLSFDRMAAERSLWQENEYNTRFEDFVEQFGVMPSYYHLLLYLMPREFRTHLEAQFQNSSNGSLSALDYMQKFFDWIMDVSDGFSSKDPWLTLIVRNTIEAELIHRFEGSMSLTLQKMLVQFVFDHSARFKWPPDSPLILQCTEWMKREKN